MKGMLTIRDRCPVYLLLKCQKSTLSSSIGEFIARAPVRGGRKINCPTLSIYYNISCRPNIGKLIALQS